MASTPAREFFDKQLERIAQGRIDEMVDNDYLDDAVLITFFNGFEDSPPPMTVRGGGAIKEYFHKYMGAVGSIDIKTLNFAEDYDGKNGSIFFQTTFICNLGLVNVGDAWQMRDAKISRHFAFWATDRPGA